MKQVFVWVNAADNKVVEGCFDNTGLTGDFFLVPWISHWFVPVTTSTGQALWDSNNKYKENWNPMDDIPLNEDGTKMFDPTLVDIVFVGDA